jgi:hypothetical protein
MSAKTPLNRNQARKNYTLRLRSLINYTKLYLEEDELQSLFEQTLYQEIHTND